jgi:hypothetical protein
LWFAHFALTALHALRLEPIAAQVDEVLPAVPAPLHASARLGLSPDGVTDVDPRRDL